MSKLAYRLTPKWGLASLLTGMMVLTIIVLLFVITFLDIRRTQAIFWRELEMRGVVLADELNDRLADSLYFLNLEQLDNIAEIVSSQPDIQRLQVFTPEGRLLVDTRSRYPSGTSAEELGRRALMASQRLVEVREGLLGVARPVVIGDKVFGGVFIAFGSDSLRSQIRGIVIEHIWQGLGLLALGVLLSHLVARQFVRPIRRLVNTAHRMAAGDLVNGADSVPGDELKELAVLFAITHIQAQPGTFGEKATRVLEELAQVAQADSVILRIPDADGQGLRLVAMAGRVHRESSPLYLRPYGGTLPGAAFQQGQPVVVNAYTAYPQATRQALAHGLKSLVALPIKAGGATLGTVSVGSLQPNHFTPNRVRLLTAIGTGLGTLLENARLYGEAMRLAEENAAVAEIGRIIGSTLELGEVYERFAAEVKKLVDFDRIAIHVTDHATGTYTVNYLSGLSQPGRHAGQVRPLAGTQTQYVVATGQKLVRGDIADNRFPTDVGYLALEMHSSVILPLLSEGRIIGTLSLRSRKTDAYGPREEAILERVTNQIAPAVANAQLYQQRLRAEEATRLRSRELESLSNIAGVLAQAGSFGEKANRVLEELAVIVQADWATLRLPDRSEPGLRLVVAAGAAAHESPPTFLLPYGKSLSGTVFRQGRVIVVDDLGTYPHPAPALVAQGMKSGVIMPIKVGDRILGVVNVVSREANHFTPERVSLLTAIGDGIGVLLENARLLEELHLRSQELESLANIAATLAGPGSFEEKVTRVLEELAEIAQADLATLRVPGEGEQGLHLMAAAGPAGWERPAVLSFERGLTSVAFQQGAPVVANDYAAHPRAEPSAVAQGTKSSVFLPIKASGRTLGVIDVLSEEVDHFTPERVRLLTAIVDGVGVLLENTQLNAEAQRLAQENAAVAEIGRIISSNLEIGEVFDQFAVGVKRLADFDRISIHVIDHDAGTFTVKYLSGLTQPGRYAGEVIPLAGTQTQYVVSTGQTLVRGDIADDRFRGDAAYLGLGLRSSILLPLVSEGLVIGTVTLRSRLADAYGPQEVTLLERLANQIAPAVANAQLYEQRLRAERALAEQAVALTRLEELERSRQRIVAAQERLRRDIAAHLHGRVQGRLLALMSRLKELGKAPHLPDEAAQPLGEVVLGMDQVIEQELAVLSRQLYPSILRQGLVPALQSLGDRFDGALEVEMCLDKGLMRQERANRNLVPEPVRLSAYRIAEEALTNVVKHARASRVTICLDLLPRELLRLTVRDNGQGLDSKSASGGLGIVTMQDYAAVMGGKCVVQGAPGQGTEVTATVPLAGRPAAHPARERP